MAALDLPINDVYLSHLHHIRNVRKAAIARASLSSSSTLSLPSSTSTKVLSESGEMAGEAAPSLISAQGTFASSSDMKASDTAILSQYPTSLVRLLVLLAPLISLSTRFVRLATWTAGPGTASHSFLLLLAWWAVCLYGYETIRYAPQAILLSILFYNGLARAFQQGLGSNSMKKSSKQVISSDHINLTIDNLTTLADFYSTLSSTLFEPIVSLVTWQSFEETKAMTIFLLTTWPIWLLCFGRQLWDVLGLPRIALQLRHHAIQLVSFLTPTVQYQVQKGLDWGRINWPMAMERIEGVHGYGHRTFLFTKVRIFPLYHRLVSLLPSSSSSSSLHLTLLPPFPLFSLSVRHIFLVLGTLALTWCSPWCALIRHALWRSALVRQSARKAIALFSGRRPSSLYMHAPTSSISKQTSSPSKMFDKDPFTGQGLTTDMTTSSSNNSKESSKDLTRHEDVIYQFTIFENQRWWMGLDWTAALLPQERPSWADESNNPVSPPSSFSLPPVKTTLKPSPTSSNPKAYVKRLVRWQWIDAEWTVAGRESHNELTGIQKNRRTSSISSTLTSGTLFSNSTATAATTGGGETAGAASGTDEMRRLSFSSTGMASSPINSPSSAAGDLPSDLQWLDVDAEGWQYGDNSWEKMSRKGGLGRYTRRRRWIRRAVLVEVVQKNYTPTEQELKVEEDEEEGSEDVKGKVKSLDSTASPIDTLPTSSVSPSSPRVSGGGNGGDLKQRLARAAQGSSSEEKT